MNLQLDLDLTGGFHVGPLFVAAVRQPPKSKISGGKAIWAKHRRAMPAWADRKAINAKWAVSKEFTAKTGKQHSVDHIVPLVNPIVCGLHVEWNLRVIPLADNVKKSNLIWPDMPFEQLELI